MNYIGIDIGGTQVKIGIVNAEGVVEKKAAYDVAFDNYETPLIETVKSSLLQFAKENGINKEDIIGIGVSSTGQIDDETGTVIGAAEHIKDWEGCCIKEHIKSVFDVPVTVTNDANCATLAEQWIGGLKGYSNAIMITVGTGVGGGIIAHSKIVCGVSGGAGELGHLIIRNNGRKCPCGNRGCYEQYASTTALVRMVKRSVKKGEIASNLFADGVVNGRTIFSAIEKDNALKQCVNKWMGYVADGLVSLIHTFDPEAILIGGGISAQREHFILPLTAQIKSRIMPEYAKRVQVEAARTGNDAGMIGAVYYCIQCGN
jgi:glucokinase